MSEEADVNVNVFIQTPMICFSLSLLLIETGGRGVTMERDFFPCRIRSAV